MEFVSTNKHVIRMATLDEVPFIMDFIDKYWGNGCLLSRDRAYFEYEFVIDKQVNFVVAVHKDTGAIDATIGLIQCTKNKPSAAFAVMWVCKPKSGTKFLGMILNENLYRISNFWPISGVGLRENTAANIITNVIDDGHYKVAKLAHYYRLACRDAFYVANIVDVRRSDDIGSSKKLIPIPTACCLRSWLDFDSLPKTPMYKDAWYIEHRYFNHPYYDFNIWGIESSPGNITGLLVGRAVHHNNSACLRIVDFFGDNDALEGIGRELDSIMEANDMEYTDFYCAGIPHETMLKAGFVLRDETDKNIIPNHFEPYEEKNVDILWSAYGAGDDLRIFKGDGDQGRPKKLRLPSDWKQLRR